MRSAADRQEGYLSEHTVAAGLCSAATVLIFASAYAIIIYYRRTEANGMAVSHKFRIGDAVLIAAVLLAAVISCLVLAMHQNSGDAVEVRTSDGQYAVYSLSVDGEYKVESGGYTLTLEIENGAARVTKSDCRCGICTAHAPISEAGECIVCLPAGTTVRVLGKGAADGEAG